MNAIYELRITYKTGSMSIYTYNAKWIAKGRERHFIDNYPGIVSTSVIKAEKSNVLSSAKLSRGHKSRKKEVSL